MLFSFLYHNSLTLLISLIYSIGRGRGKRSLTLCRMGMISPISSIPMHSKLVAHRQSYVDSLKHNNVPSSPIKTLAQPARSPSSSPKSVKKNASSGSPLRAKRQAPPPPSNPTKTPTKSETDQVAKRDKSSQINNTKDNRYSLQVTNTVNDSEEFKHRFDSLPRRSAPAPPNRRDSLSRDNPVSASKPPVHPSSPQKSGFKEADLQSSSTFSPSSSLTPPSSRRYSDNIHTGSPLPQAASTSSPPRSRSLSVSSRGSRTLDSRRRTNSGSSNGSPRYSRSRSSSKENVIQPRIELPKSFPKTDGAELVENIRERTAVSYRKTLLAVTGVLEFLKEKVPVCAEMVDGLMTAVQESQVCVCQCPLMHVFKAIWGPPVLKGLNGIDFPHLYHISMLIHYKHVLYISTNIDFATNPIVHIFYIG